MKKITISILTFSVLAAFIGADDSLAGEVIFCVDQKDQSAIIADARGLCGDGKEEYVISSTGVEQSQKLVPLVVFSNKQDCDEGSTGTRKQLGFDNNDNGILDADEVMAISGICIASVKDESEDSGER